MLIQIAVNIGDPLRLPDRFDTAVIALLVIGLFCSRQHLSLDTAVR
jgi:hypothetical protein